MTRIWCALVALAASLSLAACGSGGAAEPVPPVSTAQHSPSASPALPEAAESSPESPGETAARAFTTYAEGGRGAVPWARTVVYRISGEQVARFAPDSADRRETWTGCPKQTVTYEGRDCPVSPLGTIARSGRDGGEVVYETETPTTVGCNRYQAAGTVAASTVWIRPQDERRDCFSDFAVAVSVDGSGRVVSVDFALSGP